MIEDTSLIVNNSDAIIFSCDSKGIITSQIGGGLKLHGFYNGQHIGQNAFEAFADIPVFLKALRTALNGEKAQAIYKWGPDYCETRLVPKVGGGAIGVCTLQTERVLIQLENLQEKKNLNDLAHDIRGPLTGIQGILALGADQSQIYHKVLQTTVQSLIGVLDDTMKLEVYDSKISTEDSSNVDAHIPMKEVFELYKTSHDRFHFEIQASSENLFLKPVHRGKVYRILNNFINNACQHSKDMISVSLQVKGSMIRYNVIDNGPGIPKESHHTIFGPRPDIQYNTYRDESHGIGLYSCWKMCLQMNWDIGFFSDPLNNYTMFYLQLPKTGEVSIFKSIEKVTREFLKPNVARILIVDDTPALRLVLFKMLHKLGYTDVSVTKCGQEALDLCVDCIFDVIFIDNRMPGMSGGILHTRLKLLYPESKYVSMSAEVGYDWRGQMYDERVTKPFDPVQIDRVIRKLTRDLINYENVTSGV